MNATANGIVGTYNVTASNGSVSTTFLLTNTLPPSYTVTVATDTTTGTYSNCVNQSSGSQGSNANCSLRDALAASALYSSSTLPVTITFAQTVPTTITLAHGTLTLPSYTSIQGATTGNGASLTNVITVDGNNASSVFTQAAGAVQDAINNLTITHGNSQQYGGGISMNGSLSVSQSTFSGNQAALSGGAIRNNGGTLAVTGSTFISNQASSYYGGAIDNTASGTTAVSDSTFTGNIAGYGGGAIYNYGTATVSNSTFTANSSTLGSGFYNLGSLSVTGSIAADSGQECAGFYCSPGWEGNYIHESLAICFQSFPASASSTASEALLP